MAAAWVLIEGAARARIRRVTIVLHPGDPVLVAVDRKYTVAARVIQLREIFPGEWRIWARVYCVPDSEEPVVNLCGALRRPRQVLGLVLCAYHEEMLDGRVANSGIGVYR